MRTPRARGSTLFVAASVIAAAGVVWAAITALEPAGSPTGGIGSSAGSSGRAPSAKLPKLKVRKVPGASTLRMDMAYAGLTPDLLAAAGVTAQEITNLVGNVRQYLTDNPDEFSDADGTFHSAQTEHDRLERLVQQGRGSQNDVTALRTAETTLASALAAREAALANIRTAGVAGLTQAKHNALDAMRSNLSWRLPLQYLVVNHADSDWVGLREALANDRQSTADNVDPDPACHQRVLDANADPATTAAAANLSNLLGAVTTAYDNAITGG